MGEANEVSENGYMRDLLQRFKAGNLHHRQTEFTSANEEDREEIELNLGLSLGGCFGVDPKEKRLVRSSSIAGSTTLIRDEDVSLIRTTSLPVETEEDIRKRRDLQSLRRLEAMRKRYEKQRNFRAGKDRASLEGICEEDKPVEEEEEEEEEEGLMMHISSKRKIEQQYMVSKVFSPSVATPFGLLNWVSPALRGFARPLSQGSLGSQGSNSSGISEFESRPGQGLSNCTEGRSPASVQSLPEQCEQKPVISPRSTTTEKSDISTVAEDENPSKKAKVMDDVTGEMGMKVMEEMPFVSTKGDGPNGKRIEGFLYNYRKGEEVRIMCVCHGNFLSPAEFVKHAGGGDVAHPLKHIVVNPSSSFM